MLTILTLEILSSGRLREKGNNKPELNNIRSETDVIKEEQIRKEKNEKIEFYITFLPLLILLLGTIVMYILEKIFLK